MMKPHAIREQVLNPRKSVHKTVLLSYMWHNIKVRDYEDLEKLIFVPQLFTVNIYFDRKEGIFLSNFAWN